MIRTVRRLGRALSRLADPHRELRQLVQDWDRFNRDTERWIRDHAIRES